MSAIYLIATARPNWASATTTSFPSFVSANRARTLRHRLEVVDLSVVGAERRHRRVLRRTAWPVGPRRRPGFEHAGWNRFSTTSA